MAVTFDLLDGFSSFDHQNEALDEFSRFRGFKHETYFRNSNIFEHERPRTNTTSKILILKMFELHVFIEPRK